MAQQGLYSSLTQACCSLFWDRKGPWFLGLLCQISWGFPPSHSKDSLRTLQVGSSNSRCLWRNYLLQAPREGRMICPVPLPALVAVGVFGWLAHPSLMCICDGLHVAFTWLSVCVFYQFYLSPPSMTFVTGSGPTPSEPHLIIPGEILPKWGHSSRLWEPVHKCVDTGSHLGGHWLSHCAWTPSVGRWSWGSHCDRV